MLTQRPLLKVLVVSNDPVELEDAASACKIISSPVSVIVSADIAVALKALSGEGANIVIIASDLASTIDEGRRFEGKVPCALIAGSPTPDGRAVAERLGATVLEFPDPRLRKAVISAWISGVAAVLGQRAEISSGPGDYERRYEDLVHALPDIVYELDPDGIITFLNDSIGLLGYKPSELVGKHFSVILHDDDAAAVDRDRVLVDYRGHKTGQALSPKLFNERRGIDRRTAELEVRFRRKTVGTDANPDLIGEVISYGEVSAAGEYSRSGQGEFRGSVGIIRDVTLRRKSEEMLRKLYQAVDQLGSCVFVVNHGFETEYVNPSFFLLTGFSPADVIGRSIFRFFAFPPEKAESMRKHVQDGFDVREEVLVPKARGGQFWAEFSLSPVRSPGGVVTHAIAIVEDISSRKSIEELLRGARREAESANKAKTRFLASMTHELKNPITGIMSAAKLIGMAPEDAARRADSITEYAQTLLDILTGILDYVRSEGNDGSVQQLTFPLGAFMEGLCKPYREKAVSKGLSFTLKIEDDESVEGDPDRLGRAIGILLDNAVKFTGSGSVSVAAAIQRREGNVPHIMVEVRDTGVGIGPEDRDRIFQPFTRIGELRGVESRGAGIGLALARNLVRVLGGEIRMDSDPGTGSVFTFIVPAGTPPVELMAGKGAPYVLLVVDDNEVNLEYMRTLIENAGFKVRTAESAAEAFRVLENRYVDAAILDIQMPGYSGLELGKVMRAYTGNRYASSMPLFAMTAHDPHDVEGAENLFHTVFSKPTDIRCLLETVRTALMERETVTTVYFNSSFVGRRIERMASIASLRDAIVGAGDKLRSALRGTDSRIDVRSEAARFSSMFQRFAHPSGMDMVKLFLEHYADEERSILEGLLDRIEGTALGALAAAEKDVLP